MNALPSNVRTWILWVLPFAALGLLIGWQTDWGRAWKRVPPPDIVVAPQPVAVVVLPDYKPQATPATHRDIVERALFNPTRRPAPVAVAETAKPRLQRGQFALSGTLLIDGKATAYLRETAGGKSRRVAKGETINGMVVSEIATDRVRLTLGDESEDLTLKVAVGPKTTIQPTVAAAPAPGSAGAMGGPGAPGGPAPAAAARPPTPQDVASILADRRRVAREAEAAAATRNAGAPGVPQPQADPASAMPAAAAAPPAAPPAAADPAWNSVYQRYQQPRR